MVDVRAEGRVVKYLCATCNDIVRLDLELDEVPSSSSAGSYRHIDRPKTVLVAGAEARTRAEVADLLTEVGLRVLVAEDGDEALRMLRDEHPDLAILDLLLPVKTGIEVMREMQRDARIKDTPVLAMGAVYKEQVLGLVQRLGARGFVDRQQIGSSLVFRVLSLLTPQPAL